MGLLSWMHHRTTEKMEQSREHAYRKALGRGANQAEAQAAGERAAQRRRRIRRAVSPR